MKISELCGMDRELAVPTSHDEMQKMLAQLKKLGYDWWNCGARSPSGRSLR